MMEVIKICSNHPRHGLTSLWAPVYSDGSGYGLKYEIGSKVEPKIKCAPLFAYSADVKRAKEYAHYFDSEMRTLKIFRAKADISQIPVPQQILDAIRALRIEVEAFWLDQTKGLCWWVPSGTILCDSITLVEEIKRDR